MPGPQKSSNKRSFLVLGAILIIILGTTCFFILRNTKSPPPKIINGQDIFIGVNQARMSKGLTPYKEDNKLCTYAERRLKQLASNAGYDEEKGFYDDLTDEKVQQTYFPTYSFAGSRVFQPNQSYEFSVKGIVEILTAGQQDPEKSLGMSKSFTNACIRADANYLVVVAAE